jgi:hypothetical protein
MTEGGGILLLYMVRAFVNVTMYLQYNNDIIKLDKKENSSTF